MSTPGCQLRSPIGDVLNKKASVTAENVTLQRVKVSEFGSIPKIRDQPATAVSYAITPSEYSSTGVPSGVTLCRVMARIVTATLAQHCQFRAVDEREAWLTRCELGHVCEGLCSIFLFIWFSCFAKQRQWEPCACPVYSYTNICLRVEKRSLLGYKEKWARGFGSWNKNSIICRLFIWISGHEHVVQLGNTGIHRHYQTYLYGVYITWQVFSSQINEWTIDLLHYTRESSF